MVFLIFFHLLCESSQRNRPHQWRYILIRMNPSCCSRMVLAERSRLIVKYAHWALLCCSQQKRFCLLRTFYTNFVNSPRDSINWPVKSFYIAENLLSLYRYDRLSSVSYMSIVPGHLSLGRIREQFARRGTKIRVLVEFRRHHRKTSWTKDSSLKSVLAHLTGFRGRLINFLRLLNMEHWNLARECLPKQ